MKLVVWLFIFSLAFYSVSALGIARPFFEDNTVYMDENETMTINFQLQNMESVQKRMIFKIVSQHTMEIDGASDYENQFTLESGTVKDVSVEFYAVDEGLYRVDYSYSEICSSSPGAICFNAEVQDTFFVQVGGDDTYWGFDIPLIYDDFRLYTEARTAAEVDDLSIVSENGLIEADFSGEMIDLRSFLEEHVDIGDKRITITYLAMLNKSAVITMYQIEGNYEIYKDGSMCPLSICSVLSYSNKRLRFEVQGFSTYEIKYSASGEPSGGDSGSGSHGNIVIQPVQQVNITSEPVQNVSQLTEPEPIQEEKIDLTKIGNPFLQQKTESINISQKEEEGIEVTPIQKSLLMRTTILGGISLILLAGLLFYIKKSQEGELI
jgi:hypothetical protein